MIRIIYKVFLVFVCTAFVLSSCKNKPIINETALPNDYIASVNDVPEFDGVTPYVVIKNNEPDFTDGDLTNESYESYSPLDDLGRCGTAVAIIGRDIMPTEDRGSIGQVKPSGWHTVKYDAVDGKYLYNRCHLIGFQLTGENANIQNLITGTRYLNVEGMLPFENMVADYIKETENHVIYRVTPVFDGDNLLARGVQIEAKSVEDAGEGICFNIYAYNAQPEIYIDYSTGESSLKNGISDSSRQSESSTTYILNVSSKKIHLPHCKSVADIHEGNKKTVQTDKVSLIESGYSACKRCNP